MSRRTRSIAGVFAFLALTFSFAESVWASTCGMPATTVESEAGAFTDAPVPGDPSSSHHRAGERENEDPDHDGPCPFSSPLAAQACTGFVSMPADNAALPETPSEGVEVHGS